MGNVTVYTCIQEKISNNINDKDLNKTNKVPTVRAKYALVFFTP